MQSSEQTRVLTSWKEIATYLNRGVRTVQRYELTHGLPVRRLGCHSLFAFTAEIDLWLSTKSIDGKIEDSLPGDELAEQIKQLQQRISELTAENEKLRKVVQQFEQVIGAGDSIAAVRDFRNGNAA